MTQYVRSGENAPRLIEKWHPKKGVIVEPTQGREGEYVPHEPTPVDLTHPDVVAHQAEIAVRDMFILQDLAPRHIDDRRKQFIETIYLHREANRTTMNNAGVHTRLVEPSRIHDQIAKDVVHRMDVGTSRPYESLAGMVIMGCVSAELAKLSVLYGYRFEHYHAMMEDIYQSVDIHDGVQHPDAPWVYEIIALDNADSGAATLGKSIALKRKRHIATVKDIAIYERSSFVVCLDEALGFDQKVARQLRSTYAIARKQSIGDHTRVLERLVERTGLADEVSRLDSEQDFTSLIRLSVTVYGHNASIEQEIQAKRNLLAGSHYPHRQHAEWEKAFAYYASGKGYIPPGVDISTLTEADIQDLMIKFRPDMVTLRPDTEPLHLSL